MEETKINDLISKATKPLQDELNLLKSANNKQPVDVDYLAKSREEIANQEIEQLKEKEIGDTIKFNLSIKDFLETNSNLLPKDVKQTYESINASNIGTADDKRKEIQRSIVVSTFENKKAFDSLISAQQEKIKNFLELELGNQRKKAGEVWEILETYIDKTKYALQQEKLKRIEIGIDVSDDEQIKKQNQFNNAYKFFTGLDNSRTARIISKN